MKMIKNKVVEWLVSFGMLAMVLSPTLVAAIDLNTEPTAEDKAAFDNILTPVMKIYNFIKYAASAIAVITLLFAGISYMTSGSDPKKRDNAKGITTYVIIGLVIIWGAPMIVNMLIA
jgi:type IV secretory pathway VirB2 component (pilin)